MNIAVGTTKRLLCTTTNCSVDAENNTFFTATLTLTRTAAVFAAVRLTPKPNAPSCMKITVTIAENPQSATKIARTTEDPYEAAGWAAGFVARNHNAAPQTNCRPTPLVVTVGPADIEHTVAAIVTFVSETLQTKLSVSRPAPLAFVISAKNNASVYLEMMHHQCNVAPVDGTSELVTIGYSPEEYVNETTYKWTLTAISAWTECQIIRELTHAFWKHRQKPSSGFFFK